MTKTNLPELNRGVPLVGLLGAIVTGVALSGFLHGIAEPRPEARQRSPHHAVRPLVAAGTVLPAQNYSEMPTSSFSPNFKWQSSLSDLKYSPPGLFEPVHRTTEMTLSAIAERATTRAFDGAPPVIPHPVDQQSAASCLACHKDGLRIGKRLASKISHAHFTSCTQCHVETLSSVPFSAEVSGNGDFATNDFAGVDRSGPGTRSLLGSPPTIPHATWLREDCLSCHGLTARPGLRTTHPWLSNCVQCHAAAADLNQSNFLAGPGHE